MLLLYVLRAAFPTQYCSQQLYLTPVCGTRYIISFDCKKRIYIPISYLHLHKSETLSTPPSGAGGTYFEAGIHMPTFRRFVCLARLPRPHEPLSRPPGRPSAGEVEAGGHRTVGARKENEKSPSRSMKEPRRAETRRDPSLAPTRFWVPDICSQGKRGVR